MAGEQIRNEIWLERLDAERLVRYYAVLAKRYRFRHLGIRIMLLLAAIGGAASLLKVFPQVFQLIAGFSVVALVVVGFAFNEAGKSAVLNLIKIIKIECRALLKCRALWDEWKRLWMNLKQNSDDDVHREDERLARRLSEATGWTGHAEIGEEDHKLIIGQNGTGRNTAERFGGHPARPGQNLRPGPCFQGKHLRGRRKNKEARHGERINDLFLWDLSLTVPFIFREQFANRYSIRDCIPKWRICGSGGNWKTRLGLIPRDWGGGSSWEQSVRPITGTQPRVCIRLAGSNPACRTTIV